MSVKDKDILVGLQLPKSSKEVDQFSASLHHNSLKTLFEAWERSKTFKEFQTYCNVRLYEDEVSSAVFDSGCPKGEDLPKVNDRDQQKVMKSALSLQTGSFDAYIKTFLQTVDDWRSHCREIDAELGALQQEQSSEMRSAQQRLSSIDDDIRRKEMKLEEYSKNIMIEGAFLFVALIFGAVGGMAGIVVAVGLMFYWRSTAS